MGIRSFLAEKREEAREASQFRRGLRLKAREAARESFSEEYEKAARVEAGKAARVSAAKQFAPRPSFGQQLGMGLGALQSQSVQRRGRQAKAATAPFADFVVGGGGDLFGGFGGAPISKRRGRKSRREKRKAFKQGRQIVIRI